MPLGGLFRETASKHRKIPLPCVFAAQSTFLTLLINVFCWVPSIRRGPRLGPVAADYAFTLGRVCCSLLLFPPTSLYRSSSALASLWDMWSACYPDRAESSPAHIWTAWVGGHVCKASPMLGCEDEFGRINTGPLVHANQLSGLGNKRERGEK